MLALRRHLNSIFGIAEAARQRHAADSESALRQARAPRAAKETT